MVPPISCRVGFAPRESAALARLTPQPDIDLHVQKRYTDPSLADVIQEALAVVRGKLQTHRVDVQADSNKRLPRIRGEQVQLLQVLINLITNAIDSMALQNE